MSERNVRRPIAHFFVKKSIQMKIILTVLVTFAMTTVLTIALFIIFYKSKGANGSFYYMSDDIMMELELKSILGFILPGLIIAQLISIGIGLGIGLFSSRKVGVTIYKLEKWARELHEGRLNTVLAFRETDEMKELTDTCNTVTARFQKAFLDIDDQIKTIEQTPDIPPAVKVNSAEIKRVLKNFEY